MDCQQPYDDNDGAPTTTASTLQQQQQQQLQSSEEESVSEIGYLSEISNASMSPLNPRMATATTTTTAGANHLCPANDATTNATTTPTTPNRFHHPAANGDRATATTTSTIPRGCPDIVDPANDDHPTMTTTTTNTPPPLPPNSHHHRPPMNDDDDDHCPKRLPKFPDVQSCMWYVCGSCRCVCRVCRVLVFCDRQSCRFYKLLCIYIYLIRYGRLFLFDTDTTTTTTTK